MNRLISYVLGIVIPFTLYYSIIEFRDVSGIGAITSTLKIIGFKHKVNLGICMLIVLALLSFHLTQHFFNKYYLKKIKEAILEEDMTEIAEIHSKINSYIITGSLKSYLKYKALSKS